MLSRVITRYCTNMTLYLLANHVCCISCLSSPVSSLSSFSKVIIILLHLKNTKLKKLRHHCDTVTKVVSRYYKAGLDSTLHYHLDYLH